MLVGFLGERDFFQRRKPTDTARRMSWRTSERTASTSGEVPGSASTKRPISLPPRTATSRQLPMTWLRS